MKTKKNQIQFKESIVRNIVFGVEDSLVSTVGLVSGIAVAGVGRQTIFLTGIVLIFVEAFSMGVGTFVSETDAEEYIEGKKIALPKAIMSAVVMFISYLVAGIIPLCPYMFYETKQAFSVSILLSLISLFILGATGAATFHKKIISHGLRMLVFGGIAIAVGIIVGQVVQIP
jgi:VIT1/CCC1 family predicted Fe2+/Mn2+ transporter